MNTTFCNKKIIIKKNNAILDWTELSVQYLSSTDRDSYGQLEWLFCFCNYSMYFLPAVSFLSISLFSLYTFCCSTRVLIVDLLWVFSQFSKLCFLCYWWYSESKTTWHKLIGSCCIRSQWAYCLAFTWLTSIRLRFLQRAFNISLIHFSFPSSSCVDLLRVILYAICATAVCLKYSWHRIAIFIGSSKFLYLLAAAAIIYN